MLAELPDKKFLEGLLWRARRVFAWTGKARPKPKKRKFTRLEIKKMELEAYKVLDETKYGLCAALARQVIDVAASVDNEWVELFPVFEMVDTLIKTENCYLEVTPEGYFLRDSTGQLVSGGATLRSWLTSHVQLHGGRVTERYDRGAE